MIKRPISPRRAAEFRGWRLREWFGTRKERAERFAKLVRLYGYDYAVAVSARSERSVSERFVGKITVRAHTGELVRQLGVASDMLVKTHKPHLTYDRGNP